MFTLMLGRLAGRRSGSRLVFLGMSKTFGVGPALLLLFRFVIFPSGDKRVDLLFFFGKRIKLEEEKGR